MKIFLKKYHKFFIAAAIGAAVFWSAWLVYWPLESGSSENIEFVINKGDSSAKVARFLAEQDLVRNRFIFILYALVTGQEKSFQAGRYQLSRAMSINQIVKAFSRGLTESDDVIVTIPEGFNFFEIDKRLADSELINPGEFFTQVRAKKWEGYLFPDTYRFDKKETVDGIIKKIRANFETKVGQKLTFQQLIIASMLEKEVQEFQDMALVAGIIYKRMEIRMLLQIDATVTYGACLDMAANQAVYKFCDVSKIGVANFLDKDSPYNTYRRSDLPAGPISNPGEEAIRAALHPEKSDYLFYLTAKSDGRTIFSRNSAEHERNRAKYLK